MRPRTATLVYHTAARTWLTAAALSLGLPVERRLGLWLPLHLALAGAVSSAISGSMQTFVSALTATRTPNPVLVWSQFGLLNVGALLLAAGYPYGRRDLLVVGGIAFVAAVLLLGAIVLGALRRSLHRRHRLPLSLYLVAIASMVAGGTIGAVAGGGGVSDPGLWLALRRAHMVLNVLGWVSLTIVGTLVTLLPTVLRVRMPTWHGAATGWALAGGVVVAATGLGTGLDALAALGGLALSAGLVGIGWLVAKVLRVPRARPVATAAKHLLGSLAWFASGVVALAIALVRGAEAFDAFREPFLVVFVGGWAVQTLLGAWLYLLPMGTPGHPDERRRFLAVGDVAGRIQVVAYNVGIALLVLEVSGLLPTGLGTFGGALALAAGAVALTKAWAFPLLSRTPLARRPATSIWGA